MINVLILSGRNSHDWQRTTPLFKKVLEEDGRFNVNVSYAPEKDFLYKDQFNNVDVMVMDYSADLWEPTVQANFAEAVSNGIGLVAIHAANNWIKGSESLEKMMALVFTDESGHGEFHEFKVEFKEPEHPILKGMEPFVIEDELYHNCENLQNVTTYKVLAEAYSNPERGGVGSYQPVLIENTYGRGKIILNMLGHVWPKEFCPGYRGHLMTSVNNESYLKLLVRSCLYAAGEEVTD